jgi:hypothetical protein
VITVGKFEVDAIKLVVEAASGDYLNYYGKVDGFEKFLDSVDSDKIVFVKHAKLAVEVSKVLDNRGIEHVSAAAIHTAIVYNTLDDLNVYKGIAWIDVVGNAKKRKDADVVKSKRKAVEVVESTPKKQAVADKSLDEVIPPTPIRKTHEERLPRKSPEPILAPKSPELRHTRKSPESIHRPQGPISPKPLTHMKFGKYQLSQNPISILTESPFSHNSLRKPQLEAESAEIPIVETYQTQTGGNSVFENFMDDILDFEPMDVSQSAQSVSAGNITNVTVEDSSEEIISQLHQPIQKPVYKKQPTALTEPVNIQPQLEVAIDEEIPTIPQTKPAPKPANNGEQHKSIEIKVEVVSMCAPSRPMANYKPFRNKNFIRPKVLSVVPSKDILNGRSSHQI